MENIDVLMATYNGGMHVREQVESILSQTYTNFNLIISDDASFDNTVEILREYEKKDSRVKVYAQQKNIGYIRNFEFLLKKVKSEYYMLSDQDDIWLEDKISLSLDKLIFEKSDLVFCDLKVVDENLNTIENSMWKYLRVDKKIKRYADYRILYLYNCVSGCTILSKKAFLNKILPLPKKSKYFIHDYYIALVVSLYGKISYVDKALILYRQTGKNQVGIEKKSDKLEKFVEVRNLFIEVKIDHFNLFIENSRLFTEQQQQFNKKCLEYYRQLGQVKYVNLKHINVFYKLYKYEKISYILLNFIVLNVPILGKIGFYIRNIFKSK